MSLTDTVGRYKAFTRPSKIDSKRLIYVVWANTHIGSPKPSGSVLERCSGITEPREGCYELTLTMLSTYMVGRYKAHTRPSKIDPKRLVYVIWVNAWMRSPKPSGSALWRFRGIMEVREGCRES